jgi:hypothetical protein
MGEIEVVDRERRIEGSYRGDREKEWEIDRINRGER